MNLHVLQGEDTVARLLLDVVEYRATIAGGYARQLILPETAPEAQDIDLIPLYRGVGYYAVHERLIKYGAVVNWDSEFATSYQVGFTTLPVQVLKQRYGTPDEYFQQFTLTVEQFALLTCKMGYSTVEALEHEAYGLLSAVRYDTSRVADYEVRCGKYMRKVRANGTRYDLSSSLNTLLHAECAGYKSIISREWQKYTSEYPE